jgi:hypothetical protein
MFFNSKFSWNTFKIVLIALDTFGLQVFYPIVMLAIAYHKSILTPTEMANLPISYETLDFVAMLSLLGMVMFVTNYEIFLRRSVQKIFGLENRKWYTFFEVLILLPFAQYLLLFPANVHAIFGSLKNNRAWFMARRKFNEKKE